VSARLRQWLETLGLAQYADRFAADDIDLDVLPSLSEQDLAELGVSMGHRKRLLKPIAALTGTPASPTATPTPTPATPAATAAIAPPPSPGTTDARKVVTIVFADLIGSTSLHEQLDAESVSRLMERYYATMRTAVAEHGGTVVKLLGDSVMAAFGVPRVAEDDALRAVRAGVAMQDSFRDLARHELAAIADVGLRVGINTGEVVVAADNADVVGDPVNVAARLQAEAGDGDVVIGEATRRLVSSLVSLSPLGRLALKGRAESVKAYRVESLERPVGVAAAAFVGRDDELARLTTVYEAARGTPAARLAVLLGSPGLGKSRLIEEVGRRLGDAASVLTAHCDAAGGATFAPIAAALREHLHIEAGASEGAVQETIAAAMPEADAERGRIATGIAALLADSPGSPEETFFVIRRFRALEQGDWAGHAAPCAPDVIINDHRLAGFGVAHGRAFMIRAAEAMAARAPDARLRMGHVRACRRGRLTQRAWSGTGDGGAFESPFVLVAENGPDGRIVRLDSYDLQHVDRALARFAELRDRPTAADGGGDRRDRPKDA